jgi:undecaprenyl-diphosphatase
MLEYFTQFDTALFYWINVHLANPVMDKLMVAITLKENWMIPGTIVGLWLMFKQGKKGRIVAVLLLLSILFADQISSSILKPAIGRLRPCKTLEYFRLLVHCGGVYGFPSSHAANIAAALGTFAMFYRKTAIPCLVVIFLVGISRVVVGVHYPADVLGGWVLGGIIAYLLFGAYHKLSEKYLILDFKIPSTMQRN